jgi:ribosome-binding protein aMBF1 (putative translation factor)
MTARKSSRSVARLGGDARAAADRRRASDPKYAELEKKFEVALGIADLVILHRTRSGLTQEQLAERMGTSISAVSRLESGFHVPSMETLRKVAEAVGGRVKIDIVDIAPARTSRPRRRPLARN